MNFSRKELITVNEILSDVLPIVKDYDFRMSSRGYYISQIQQALQELSFDTFFDRRYQDFDIPANLRVELPEGAFNVRELYVYSGTECRVGHSEVVYHKKNFINDGNGGYIARDTWNNENDAFHKRRDLSVRRDEGFIDSSPNFNDSNQGRQRTTVVHFYSVQQGEIHLSRSTKRFSKLRIVFNGMGGKIGDTPLIPPFFRQAVKDYTAMKGLIVRMAEADGADFNKWSTLYSMIKSDLGKGGFRGSWNDAEVRVKRLDSKYRTDLKEYLTRLNY